MKRCKPFAAAAIAVMIIAGGCCVRPPEPATQAAGITGAITGAGQAAFVAQSGLASPHLEKSVQAVVAPPEGWSAEPLKSSGRHKHQLWISPSGKTAYGVINIPLPLPISSEFMLPFFLSEMRRSEGEATLLSRQYDEALHALRFEADGNLYRIRTNLIVRGTEAWAVYAGTVRSKPVDNDELDLAVRAREHTIVGKNQ